MPILVAKFNCPVLQFVVLLYGIRMRRIAVVIPCAAAANMKLFVFAEISSYKVRHCEDARTKATRTRKISLLIRGPGGV